MNAYLHPFWPGPAAQHQSEDYPRWFRGLVPLLVRPTMLVRPDWPIPLTDPQKRGIVVTPDEVYPSWTNSHGAVAAYLPDGQMLGLKPAEFEVVRWFDPRGALFRGAKVLHVQRSPDASWCGQAIAALRRVPADTSGAPCRTCARELQKAVLR